METKTCFDSRDVMAYILGACEKKGIRWNLTKAQKLLYCCYGAILATFGERLTEEAISKLRDHFLVQHNRSRNELWKK